MTRRCERCLTAFDDTARTCPYCGSDTEQDNRSLEQLSSEGYLVSRRLLSPMGRRNAPQKRTTGMEQAPSSNPTVKHTHAYKPPGMSSVEQAYIEPVHIEVDDELERLRRGYEMSVAATELSEHDSEPERVQQTSGHASQQDNFAVPGEAHIVEPPAVQSVDELIESLRVDIPHVESEEYAAATALTHQVGADTSVQLPPIAPDDVEWDDIEALSGMRERADREYRRTARREAFVGFLRDLTTPGTVPHWIATALFLVLCGWLLIVYVLPAMVGAVVVTIESLLPYLIAIGIAIYALRLLIHP